MIIQSDSYSMNSGRNYSKNAASFKALSVWDNRTGFFSRLSQAEAGKASENTSKNELLEQAKDAIEEEKSKDDADKNSIKSDMNELMERFKTNRTIKTTDINSEIEAVRRIQQQTLNYLLYLLFGKKSVDDLDTSFLNDDGTQGEENAGFSTAQNTSQQNGDSMTSESVGGEFASWNYYSEQETTSFETKGTVITADGRQIDFNVSMKMSRRFEMRTKEVINFGASRCTDPLVINLDSNVCNVSDQKFLFDLDSDGTEESISMLGKGSGFLALDKNGDGVINDGSELFGTASGDGFADLMQYDQDGNGWIDEADEIFDKLRIWQMNEDGTSTLVALGKAGVGAICLGTADTEFSLNSYDNTNNAVIRKTGMFLYENGIVGTMQQVDMAT